MRHFRTDPAQWDKGGGAGPVSEADLEVDELLRDMLCRARPDYGWLSEESEDDPARLSARRVFVIDPIDGTRAFLAGEESFAHSLAVVEDGRPVAGVVHLPARGETFTAARGGGAQCNGRPIAVSRATGADGARVLAARGQLEPRRWPGGVPPVERHFRNSLAWRMALVAGGRFDAMITLRDCWEWDIAAGALICEEAGGLVVDRHGRALVFNTAAARTPGVLAGAPAVVRDLLKRL
ncbi:MAG: 3'(2'),5'-bisphosphate nucleotidase CysQ [Alphaproteobacteria bacterium]|nr:MAG: 3'(2'),5'-bisphosphate nucleotidase CysQ [Alphaproteobacteria bacterium]